MLWLLIASLAVNVILLLPAGAFLWEMWLFRDF